MDPLMNLPNEMVEKICENLETPDLLNLMENSSRAYQSCQDIIKKRKKSYEEESKAIKEIEKRILDRSLIAKKSDTTVRTGWLITGGSSSSNSISIIQSGSDMPPILPEMKSGWTGVFADIKNLTIKVSDVRRLAENLYKQGYQIIP